jgi:hypothetical protein
MTAQRDMQKSGRSYSYGLEPNPLFLQRICEGIKVSDN